MPIFTGLMCNLLHKYTFTSSWNHFSLMGGMVKMKMRILAVSAVVITACGAVVVVRDQDPPTAPVTPAAPPPLSQAQPELQRIYPVIHQTNVPAVTAQQPAQPVQSIDERGDAMLFEIDALGTMPFDDAITRPFD
jgi:hypothetical protein